MENTFKRAISLVMTLLMIFSTVACISGVSLAADIVTENEPNNGSNAATLISVDTLANGSLSNGDDVDWYKFSTDKDYFTISFIVDNSLVDIDKIAYGWSFSLYTVAGEEIRSYSGIKSTMATIKLPLKGTFLIKVSPDWSTYPPADCVYGLKIDTFSDSTWEKESNNQSNLATTISTDKIYQGVYHNSTDEDWYKFTTSKDYFNIYFNVNEDTDISMVGYGWYIGLYAEDGKEILKEYGGIDKEFCSVKLPYTGTFYLKIAPDWSTYPPVDCYYDLKINTYTDGSWENEKNDTSNQAMSIAIGKNYKGALQNRDDNDWYYFENNSSGAFNVNLSVDKTSSYNDIGSGWSLSVYQYGSTDPVVTYSNIVSEKNTFSIPFKGKMLIKVVADWSANAPIDCVYNLKVSARPSAELWEKEINDKAEAAFSIAADKKYNANLYHKDDRDYFKYKCTKDGTLVVNFSRDVADDTGDGWKVSVVESNGTVVDSFVVRNDLKVTRKGVSVSKNKTYYIVVEADWTFRAPGQSNYQVNVKFTPKLSAVKKLKVSSQTTSSINLTWNKVAGAEKYEVYYSTNGKSWKKVSATKNSVTIKKLKVGTTYKVKVRAVAGKNKGAYSSVLTTSTKPASVTLSKLTAGSKTLTATWKTVSGATGYEVQYSTSKKFSKKTTKTVTIKKAKTKKTTIKKLKKGKKYYVKVRAYKTVSGKKICGAWSAVKSVKVK